MRLASGGRGVGPGGIADGEAEPDEGERAGEEPDDHVEPHREILPHAAHEDPVDDERRDGEEARR